MPLFLLYLSNIGDIMAKSFKWIYAKVCLCRICPGVAKRREARNRRKIRAMQRQLNEEYDDEDVSYWYIYLTYTHIFMWFSLILLMFSYYFSRPNFDTIIIFEQIHIRRNTVPKYQKHPRLAKELNRPKYNQMEKTHRRPHLKARIKTWAPFQFQLAFV